MVSASANTYAYDSNGNMSTRNGSTITWTSYNLPASLSAGGYTATFDYAPDRSRWRQISTYSGGTETTIYVGGLMEKLTTSTRVHWKHRIPTPSGEVQVIRRSDGTNDVFYVTTDHLGSTDAVTNAAGAVVVRESFAAYGARRGSNWATSTAPDWTGIANTTRRGYTSHEQLDNVMLVHMNGRVYDPAIGRFLSADPYVKSMDASQGWNRYSYVSNNPLAYTDPSGYADQRPPNVQPVTPPPPPPPPDNVRTRVTWRFFFFYYDDDPLAGARAWLTAAQHLPGGMQGGEHGGGGGGGGGRGDGADNKTKPNCDSDSQDPLEAGLAFETAAAEAAARAQASGILEDQVAAQQKYAEALGRANAGRLAGGTVFGNVDWLKAGKTFGAASAVVAAYQFEQGWSQGGAARTFATIDVVVGLGSELALGPLAGTAAAATYSAFGGSKGITNLTKGALGLCTPSK